MSEAASLPTAVVPGLVADAGCGAFVRGVAQDEAVLGAMEATAGGQILAFVQFQVVSVHDVDS